LNRTPAEGEIAIDPFGDDPGLSGNSMAEVSEEVVSPYDVFADDPPLSERPE
jgi:hypothetical protein